jgi:CrcB protein
MNVVYIVIGGGIGALLRYLSIQYINSILGIKHSIGTLSVNCISALLIGFLVNSFGLYSINLKWKLIVITRFLSGYTTFSTYFMETAQYFLNGNYKQAFINILLNNVLRILFALFGILINKMVIK